MKTGFNLPHEYFSGMRIIKLLFISLFIYVFSVGFNYRHADYREGMYKNVCKDLKNNVLVYLIFVDTKETSPWTEFDIRSTLDSVQVAARWIEEKANLNGIQLNIINDYYIGKEYTTVRKNLLNGNVEKTISTPNFKKGFKELNNWADNIAKKVGADIQLVEKDGIPEIQNPRNKERLIAHLRDEKKVESVALLFLVNNYFKEDISVVVNQFTTNDVEFAVVSYKYPAVIAQNIISLFGAADLYKSLYRRDDKKIQIAAELFPDDIMQDVYAKNINKLEIGNFTKYLIGWSQELDPKYEPLLTDKIANY
jgi:hypothetical protein